MKDLNIQGLRAVFAFIVFLGHSMGALRISWYDSMLNNPLHLFWDGSVSVVFFFVLSGWFYINIKEDLNVKSYLRFVFRRTIKITPPYWISLIIGAIILWQYNLWGIGHSPNVTDWFAGLWKEGVTCNKIFHDFLIFNRGYGSADYIIPASWYLETDLKMMLEIPIIIVVLKKTSWHFVWLFFLLALFNKTTVMTPFLIGATFHYYLDHISKLLTQRKWLIYFGMFIGICCMNIKNQSIFPVAESSFVYLFSIIQALGAGIVISIVASVGNLKILSNKILVWFGDLSYEFYIIHMVVLLAMEPFFTNPLLFIVSSFFMSVIVTVMLREICKPICDRIRNLV